jgi:hypothetical protein
MVSALKEADYETRLQELGMFMLEARRNQADMLMMYKIMNGKEQVDTENWSRLSTAAAARMRQQGDRLNVRENRGSLDISHNFSLASWKRLVMLFPETSRRNLPLQASKTRTPTSRRPYFGIIQIKNHPATKRQENWCKKTDSEDDIT